MQKTNKTTYLIIGVIALVLLRCFLNSYIPLMDKTEARYGEIARIMAETGNWITPQIDYRIPFWAKPPLSTWLSAISIKIFGVNEFAVRLPALLLAIVLIIILKNFIKSKKAYYLLAFILLTLPEFLLHAGVVSTDAALSFCVAIIFFSFWKLVTTEKVTHWNYLLFVFFGLGMLSKGPIIFILTVPPIFIWMLIFRKFKTVLKKTPWFLGILILLIITIPWYLMAENKTEGFLEYFIVGEHYKRFFDASWNGDKYGFPKNQPKGIIWVFLFAFAFPWIQFLIIKLWNQRKNILKNKWVVFLLLWLLWTPFFFSFSKSLIHTYTLPVMLPIALLVVHYWTFIKNKVLLVSLSLIFPIAIVITLIISFFNNNLENYSNTDKYLLEKVNNSTENLYYFGTKSYSSQFYSKGKINSISLAFLKEKLNENNSFIILIPNKYSAEINEGIISKFNVLTSNKKSKIYSFVPIN